MKTIRELSRGKRDIWQLDPRVLKTKPGWNPRDETEQLKQHIATIAASIVAVGYDAAKPLTVYQDGDDYFISDGHCRLRAVLGAIKAGTPIETVPVVLESRGINEEARVAGILTRNNGLRLEPLEQGRVYLRLQGFGWTDKKIAETSGMSISHVKQIFELMAATPEAQAMVKAGDVSATTVAAATKKHGPARAAKVIRQAVESAKSSGKSKATHRAVERVSNGIRTLEKPRPLSEIIKFFRECIAEKDAPTGTLKFMSIFLRYRDGYMSPESFAKQVGEIF